ncbi:ABC transporter substrate-binding protein [Brevibacterium casei]|uniref:ABC transporter substrate-binding protein n=1 Tax=Brevibacterium casei S18 TaxID=1229781 RepID=K9AH29_9MICO|nr:ABC transporter substrate-binding protein [Brevibacterium casei]EKU46628.1 ABC transporter substrate-binding protein [Brevibacterium casei S18]
MKFASPLPITALSAAAVIGLGGCSVLPSSAGAADGPFPQTIDSPYGTTTIEDAPTKIAVASPTDLDIALALGAEPVIAPAADGDDEFSPWAQSALDDSGAEAPQTYDGTDGPDIAAITQAEPDVILATGLEDAGDHFDDLSEIAPVVAAAPDATWTDRTAAVATALDTADKAKQVVGDITTEAEDIAGRHLEFEDTTYTVADVQKSSIDYLSYDGSDDSFFSGLGLLPAPEAASYSAEEHSVKKAKVDDLDADVLLIRFPDTGKGLLDESDLADPFYREVKVIRGKHYAVLSEDEFAALTNLSPLSYPWLLDELPDAIGKAEQGEA